MNSTPGVDYPATADGGPCAFCEGTVAAERGEPRSSNPYAPDESANAYDTAHGLWESGYILGHPDASIAP